MVDAERLARVLSRVSDGVASLRRYAAMSRSELKPDPELNAVKYLFVTSIEACVDAAQHVCASEGWGAPATNADAMRVLARHDVLEPALAERLAAAVGFRNVLVHEYADVDDAVVVGALAELGDLDAFVAAMSRLLG